MTISGPKEAVGKFVEKLKEEGVFARMVKTGGIAFHSKAMQAVAPQFKKRLESVSVGVRVHASGHLRPHGKPLALDSERECVNLSAVERR